jgi:hypothetical protein
MVLNKDVVLFWMGHTPSIVENHVRTDLQKPKQKTFLYSTVWTRFGLLPMILSDYLYFLKKFKIFPIDREK